MESEISEGNSKHSKAETARKNSEQAASERSCWKKLEPKTIEIECWKHSATKIDCLKHLKTKVGWWKGK